ncbi:Cupredoxin [Cytidiella melzeri]|nr:Cupredoxin [Cytidiella melzeri]
MHFSTLIAAFLVPATALAANIIVKVGNNGTLTYDPPSVTAVNGDVISFQFLSKNHTLTQSTFATPCQNISANGLDSGFQFVPPNATTISQYSFTMTNVSGPLWFYCRQANHCQQGMVFAVNPTAQKTFAAFQANAMASGNATTTSGSATVSTAAATGTSSPSSTPAANAASALKMGASSAMLLSGVGLLVGLVL